MNLDIVGLIKLNPARGKMYDACIHSLYFLGAKITIYDGHVADYGKKYLELMEEGGADYIGWFCEDHFMLLDDAETVTRLLDIMKKTGAEVMKASFHQIEMNSIKGIEPIYEDDLSFVYINSEENHKKYCQYYGNRFYYGCNTIVTRDFAKRFWDRSMGHRPHEYELPKYRDEFRHVVLVPKIEVFASVDDGHGLDGSQLLKREEKKFWKMYGS